MTKHQSTENVLADVPFEGVPEDIEISKPSERPTFQVGQTVYWSLSSQLRKSGTVRAVSGYIVIIDGDDGQEHRVSAYHLQGDPVEPTAPRQGWDERPKPEIFDVRRAAEYLGVVYQTLKHAIHNSRRLVPDGDVSGNQYFFKETLDEYRENVQGKRGPTEPNVPRTSDDNPIYSLSQVREYLGYARYGLEHALDKGRLVPDGYIGQYLFFFESTLENYKRLWQAEGLTTKEANARAGKSSFWLEYHRQKGRIQPIGKRGKNLIYDPDDVDRLIAEYSD